jgi:hypothetical protein
MKLWRNIVSNDKIETTIIEQMISCCVMYLSIDSNAKWWKIENTPLKYTYKKTEMSRLDQ